MEKLRLFIENITNIPYRIVKGYYLIDSEKYTVEFGDLRVRLTFTLDTRTDKVYFHYRDSLLDLSTPNNAILLNDYLQLHETMLD